MTREKANKIACILDRITDLEIAQDELNNLESFYKLDIEVRNELNKVFEKAIKKYEQQLDEM